MSSSVVAVDVLRWLVEPALLLEPVVRVERFLIGRFAFDVAPHSEQQLAGTGNVPGLSIGGFRRWFFDPVRVLRKPTFEFRIRRRLASARLARRASLIPLIQRTRRVL